MDGVVAFFERLRRLAVDDVRTLKGVLLFILILNDVRVHVVEQLPVSRHELNRSDKSVLWNLVRYLDDHETIRVIAWYLDGLTHLYHEVRFIEPGVLDETRGQR